MEPDNLMKNGNESNSCAQKTTPANGIESTQLEMVDTAQPKVMDSAKKQNLKPVSIETNFYHNILAAMSPFIIFGIPINYCFEDSSNVFYRILLSIPAKIFTVVHVIYTNVFFCILLFDFFFGSRFKSNEGTVEERFLLKYYQFIGLLSVNFYLIHKKSIEDILKNSIDFCPKTVNEKFKTLYASNDRPFKYYFKWKCLILQGAFSILVVGFYIFDISMFFPFAYNRYKTVYNDIPGALEWRYNTHSLMSILASVAFLILLVWAIKYKIMFLNLFVNNLTTMAENPHVSDIEIIKEWYQNISSTAKEVNKIFLFFIPIFLLYLFTAIINWVNNLIDLFHDTNKVSAASTYWHCFLVAVLVLVLIFFLNQLSEVHEQSSTTKSVLYKYVLATQPEERSTLFYDEVNFVIAGLLNEPIKFTLFGHIEFTRQFMSRLLVAIYTYSVIWNNLMHKFHSPIGANKKT